LFTLCLDLEYKPESDAEAAYLTHSCNFGNRWNHSSLQLVVYGNAKACAIFNFTAHLDGNMMSRAAAEIQKRGCLQPLRSERSHLPDLPEAKELKWRLHPRMEQSSRFDISQMLDNQPASFELSGMGREFFSQFKLEPVPAFIVALQMTTDRFLNRRAVITQFLTMSRYRCMDLTHTNLNTPEVFDCAEKLNQGNISRDEARSLLNQAFESQHKAARRARQYLNLPTIIALYALSNTGPKRFYIDSLHILMHMSLRILGLYRNNPREVLVSHPEIMDVIPVIGRPGVRLPYVRYYGLHYQIMDEKTVITMMPAVVWTIPNAAFIEELKSSLQKIQKALEEKSSEHG
jgi:Choline/Carnitine o-acyltransferase